MRRPALTRLVGATVVVAALAVGLPATGASASGGDSAIAAVRAATAAYHDIANVPAVYQDSGLPCMQSSQGGMGIHLLDGTALNDPSETATHPEALVYAETPDGPQLVAVEYIVPAPLVDPENPPTVLGQTLTKETVPGVPVDLYVLHAWIWRHNPAGMFQDFNPALDSCPSS